MSRIAYALSVTCAFVVAAYLRQREVRRLGYQNDPRHRWVGVGCLLGAMLGTKLGMVLFLPVHEFAEFLFSFDFDGKTVLGGLFGGYLGGEITKKLVGVNWSTGDAWAISLPVGQAIGRWGCHFAGCCYGTPNDSVPWRMWSHGAFRHPAALYESLLLLVGAGILYSMRTQARPAGWLFRYYFIGYATIRLVLEFFRADVMPRLGPLSPSQWFCVCLIVWMSALLWRDRQRGLHLDAGVN